VLLDWRPSMRLAAAILGIPVVALVNAHVTRQYRGPLAAPEQHPITRRVGRRLADRLMPIVSPFFYRQWARPYQQYARAHGHRGWSDLRDYLTGDSTLYPDLPSLAPTRPGKGIHIGPLVQYPLPTEPLPPLRDPVLYLTLGSLSTGPKTTAALIAAVVGWPGSVIATHAGWTRDWPAEWVTAEYVDPFMIMQQGHRAAWMFHSGNGSSYQLLQLWAMNHTQCAGAIALPFHVEQEWNAHKLADLGVVTMIGSLHNLGNAVRDALMALPDHRLPPPPAQLTQELALYADAPQRAAEEVRRWL